MIQQADLGVLAMETILVVEDHHSLRKDIMDMLRYEGYDVHGAADGVEGIERAMAIKPDLIICDIMMPELDGWGMLTRLRDNPSTQTIPFIFLTARADRHDQRLGMEMGADDFLTKPFHATELLRTMRMRLLKHKAFMSIGSKQMDDLRSNIITALPHELRTPLNVILGFSDILMTEADRMSSDQIAEYTQHVHNAGMRLYHLVENFLTYAHTEIILTNEQERERFGKQEGYYPAGVIQTVADEIAAFEELPYRPARTQDLVFDLVDVERMRLANDDLKKVIAELVDNACKFSPSGTPITIESYIEGRRYVVRISDRGRGMALEQIDKIAAYMQFDRRIYEQRGAGLGLIICKRLVELHEGEFLLESAVNEGTTVTIRLQIID